MKTLQDDFPNIRVELGADCLVARACSAENSDRSEPPGEPLIGTGVACWLLELNGDEAATIPFLFEEPRPETVIRMIRWLDAARTGRENKASESDVERIPPSDEPAPR